jgi:hypothetical protein
VRGIHAGSVARHDECTVSDAAMWSGWQPAFALPNKATVATVARLDKPPHIHPANIGFLAPRFDPSLAGFANYLYCTAMVTVFDCAPAIDRDTGIALPVGTLDGTWAFTRYRPTNPGANPEKLGAI